MEGNRIRNEDYFLPLYIIGPYLRQHIKHLGKLWYGSSTVSYSDLTEELNFILITPIQIVLRRDKNLISTIFHRKKKLKRKKLARGVNSLFYRCHCHVFRCGKKHG